jgi:hypothetical protein
MPLLHEFAEPEFVVAVARPVHADTMYELMVATVDALYRWCDPGARSRICITQSPDREYVAVISGEVQAGGELVDFYRIVFYQPNALMTGVSSWKPLWLLRRGWKRNRNTASEVMRLIFRIAKRMQSPY